MTHLHFDHCGVQWNKDKTGYEPAFKNAKFWSNEVTGNGQQNQIRESFFLSENILPMQESELFIKSPK
jgi:glyoxylase-like metal-dependent hydrolase (beta-lactamase superfamily II)